MKVISVFLCLFAVLSEAVAIADVKIPQHLRGEEPLLMCETDKGRQLLVSRNQDSDTFSILYGEDLNMPVNKTVKSGNNLGTAVKYADEVVESREVYAVETNRFTTVGVTDRDGKKGGYITVWAKEANATFRDDCILETMTTRFFEQELFASLTDVD